MTNTDIIAVGRMKRSPVLPLWEEYFKRMRPAPALYEIETGDAAKENTLISEKLDEKAFVFALDEQGRSLRSGDFSARLEKLYAGGRKIQFVIGGADGLSRETKDRADFLLSFGNQTWPHMLVRVMLLEQLYRAQQIQSGHPYHRE